MQVKRSLRKTGAHIRTQPRAPIGRLHVKKGDVVLVLSGNDKGKTGAITEALPRAGRVIVDGVNLRWRHKKPTQQNPKGERVQHAMSIHASNVALADSATKGTPAAKAAKPAKAAKAPRAPKARAAAKTAKGGKTAKKKS